MGMYFSRRGQNIIEYILLRTAVVVVLVTVVLVKNGAFVSSITKAMESPGRQIGAFSASMNFVDGDEVAISRDKAVQP